MFVDPLFEKVAKIVDPEDKLSGNAIIKLVEKKFTSTNSAMDAIALLKLANDAHTNNWVDSWFTSNKQTVNAVVAQQHQ